MKKGLLRRIEALAIAAILTSSLALSGCTKGNNVDDHSPDDSHYEEEEAAAAEETAEVVEEAEEVIETTEETAAEEVMEDDSESRYKEAMASYLDVLLDRAIEIQGYNWLTIYSRYNESEDSGITMADERKIAFAEITGDEIPELIFMAANRDETRAKYEADLHVFSYDGEAAIELLEDALDVQAGGGMNYALFTLEGETALFVYKSMGDENWTDAYRRYEYADGSLEQTYELRKETGPTEDYEDVYLYCYENDAEIPQAEFNSKLGVFVGLIDNVLTYNFVSEEPLWSRLKEIEPSAMTFKEALDYTAVEAGDALTDEQQGALEGDPEWTLLDALDGETRSFYFASGAGGWGTELVLNQDGTFTGNYHDSEMGDTRAENGVCYVASFSGRFDKVEKIDESTWKMHLADLTCEKTVGEEWKEDGILYIASEAYGVAGGDTFYIYKPGRQTADLPEEFCQWILRPLAYDEMPAALPFFGLYNEAQQAGFFSAEG